MSCKYLAVVAGILVLGAMPAFAHTVNPDGGLYGIHD